MKLKVRKAKAADLPELGRMGGALARQHHQFDPERFMLPDDPEGGYRWWLGKELKNKRAVILVAEREDGRVIGYAYGRLEDRDWNALLDAHGGFHDVWVDAIARGEGFGEALSMGLLEALVALGAKRVVLKSAAPNKRAQKMFARLGWRPTMIEMTREA